MAVPPVPTNRTSKHGWRWDYLDADLIEAIQSVLERRGRSVREEVARKLLQFHGIGEDGTELTQPPYLWEPLERFYPEVMRFADLSERATFRSPWPETSFCLICDASQAVELELTARLPTAIAGASRRGRIGIAVNGCPAGIVEAAERWTRSRVQLEKGSLRRGLNRLTLSWPSPQADGLAALRTAVERLELGISDDLHPVFGEIFSLKARVLS